MPDLRPILAQLDKTRRGLLLAADSVPNPHWRASPQPGAWSAGEVVAHLMMVEGTIISKAGRLVCQPPKMVPVWKRVHLPVILAEWRAVRRRTPIPLDESLVSEKGTMLARLRKVREKTLAFIGETGDRALHAASVGFGLLLRGEGLHVAAAVFVAPVGVPATEDVSHGDSLETGLPEGAWLAAAASHQANPGNRSLAPEVRRNPHSGNRERKRAKAL